MPAPDPRNLVAESRALCEKATTGPWTSIKSIHGHKYRCVQIGADESYSTLEMMPSDAALIARARTLIPELADALERAARIESALADAAASLETASRWGVGSDDSHADRLAELRQWAASRARVAREALSSPATDKEPAR